MIVEAIVEHAHVHVQHASKRDHLPMVHAQNVGIPGKQHSSVRVVSRGDRLHNARIVFGNIVSDPLPFVTHRPPPKPHSNIVSNELCLLFGFDVRLVQHEAGSLAFLSVQYGRLQCLVADVLQSCSVTGLVLGLVGCIEL